MIMWTGLALWEFDIPFPGSLTSTFLERLQGVEAQVTRRYARDRGGRRNIAIVARIPTSFTFGQRWLHFCRLFGQQLLYEGERKRKRDPAQEGCSELRDRSCLNVPGLRSLHRERTHERGELRIN